MVKSKMVNKENVNKKKSRIEDKKAMIMTGVLLLVILVIVGSFLMTQKEESENKGSVQNGGDIVINKNEVGEQATFYSYEVDGIDLEVIAVKATDGTIRTAFNTCQICYASGRGYYKQEGDFLICQNCGNGFTTDDVQVSSGGCNPVPIFAEYKTETKDSITIKEEFMKEAKDIFMNWRDN